MKVLIFVTIAISALSVFAQGTVSFVNRSAGGTSHVWYGANVHVQYQGDSVDYPGLGMLLIGTVGGLNGPTTFAQLLGAPGTGVPESNLLPGSPTTTFRTGAAAGNVALVTATFNNIPLDAPVASFEMVAWDNSSGLYPTWTQASAAWAIGLIAAGRSAEFTLNQIGGTTFTPPNVEPALQSFNIFSIIPEPSTAALAGLGAAVLLIFRRRK
jgi:hypothetical protein